MAKKFKSLLAGLAVIGGAATLFAQGGPKPAEGTLMLQDKNYPLTHALAYETTINEEEVIAVVLSGQAISSENFKEAIEKEKDSGFADFKRPFLKLDFAKAGQLKFWSAAAGGTSLGRRGSGNATGELKLQDGRVSGKASQPRDSEGMFPTAFDVRFDVALLRAGESLPATIKKKPGPAANVKPSVTGVFKGAPLACQSGMSSLSARGSMTAPDKMCAPTSEPFSSTQTLTSRPASPASFFNRMAAESPDGPPPTITTSYSIASRCIACSLRLSAPQPL